MFTCLDSFFGFKITPLPHTYIFTPLAVQTSIAHYPLRHHLRRISFRRRPTTASPIDTATETIHRDILGHEEYTITGVFFYHVSVEIPHTIFLFVFCF